MLWEYKNIARTNFYVKKEISFVFCSEGPFITICIIMRPAKKSVQTLV